MEIPATVERVPATKSAALEASPAVKALALAESATAMPATFATQSLAAAESVMVSIPATALVAAPSAIVATSIEAMEPRTCANKHAPGKVVRAIIAVRCACVWGIPIIAVRAHWSRPHVGWPNANANSNPDLRMSRSRHNHAEPEQNCVFKISHLNLLDRTATTATISSRALLLNLTLLILQREGQYQVGNWVN
jgi:hypothetical protein